MIELIEYNGEEYPVRIEEKNSDGDLNYVAYFEHPILIAEFGETMVWKVIDGLPERPDRNIKEQQQMFVDKITECILQYFL